MGKSIFKFFSVTKYSIDALSKSQLFCSHYSAFNDPFECWCKMLSGIPHPEREKVRFAAAYKAWGFEEPDYSQEGKVQLNEYCEQFNDVYAIAATKYTESARITCFTRDINNLLMWSHYTDGLRGFCIEFDSEKLTDLEEAIILKVKYKREPETFDATVFSIAEDQVDFHKMVIQDELRKRKHLKSRKEENIRQYADWLKRSKRLLLELYSKQLAVKPLEWSYEKEMRLIFHKESNSTTGEIFSYPVNAVKSIVFGEKITPLNKKIISDILIKTYPDIAVGTATRDRLSYKINIQYDSQSLYHW